MEYDTYYYMTHPPYSTNEDMLRDAECWDDSIKEKYNQQPASVKEEDDEHKPIIKEEYEAITKEESEPMVNEDKPTSSFVIQRNSLDVCLRLVDCLDNRLSTTAALTTTTTTTTTTTEASTTTTTICEVSTTDTDSDNDKNSLSNDFQVSSKIKRLAMVRG